MPLTHLYTATTRRGLLPVTVDIYADSGPYEVGAGVYGWRDERSLATGSPNELTMRTGGKLKYLRPQTAYGTLFYPSMLEVGLSDDDGALGALFAAMASESEYLVTVSAPAHPLTNDLGLLWYGRPMLTEGRAGRTIAPRRYPRRSFMLRAYCTLGAMARRRALPALGTSLTFPLVRALLGLEPTSGGAVPRQLMYHLPIVFAPDGWPTNAAPGDISGTAVRALPSNLTISEEPAGTAEDGDYGTYQEQVTRILAPLGLAVYQACWPGAAGASGGGSAPPVPAWHAVHRASIGAELTDTARIRATTTNSATIGAVSVAPNVLAVPAEWVGGEERDTVEVVSRLAAVRVSGTAGNLVPQPFPSELQGAGQYARQELVPIFPTPDLRVRFSVVTSGGGKGRLLFVDDAQGDTYYLQSGGTWLTSLHEFTTVTNWPSTEDFPGPGTLFVEAGNGPVAGVAVELIDAVGDLIDAWLISYENRVSEGGDVAELEAPPRFEVFDGTGAADPASFSSLVYADADGVQQAYSSLIGYGAGDLLAQRAGDLDAPECSVRGLHGPGRRLEFPAKLMGTPYSVPCVVGGGLELDLDKCRTRGGWTEAALVTPGDAPPEAPDDPTNLELDSVGDGTATLSWDEVPEVTAAGADGGYKLYYDNDASGEPYASVLQLSPGDYVVSGGRVTYTLTGLTNGPPPYYAVVSSILNY